MFEKKKQLPELYTEKEMDIVEEHIMSKFGNFQNVFHEISSPDIHVDVCIIEPTPERNYYTLITMGMGAHKMNVPKELRKNRIDRAEILIALPPDWEIQNPDEKWYWPIRCIKTLARLPGGNDTWLGHGHTMSNEEPYAENTELCCAMLTFPYDFPQEAAVCELPDGDRVVFYQVLPLYEDEMNFKLENGAEKLEDLFPDDYDFVLDIGRRSVLQKKDWYIKAADIKDLFHWDEAEGCFATDRILVDGCKVGYMYREEPDGDWDSGWRFTAGDESDEYMDDPNNSGIYALNTVANNDPEIIPFLTAPCGSAFIRDDEGALREEESEEE